MKVIAKNESAYMPIKRMQNGKTNIAMKGPVITKLSREQSKLHMKERVIRTHLYEKIHNLRNDLPMKFLLSLSSDTSGVKVEFQEVRKRAYLMLSAWADEMRLRRMAQALRPWWKLVIYHRSIEYRLGISARIIWNAIRKVIYKTLYKKWVKWVRNIIELREVERDAAARLLQRVYRGYNARCTFAEHARRWIACIPIQTLWRKYACILKYQCTRRLIINLQARIRLYLCQRYMYLLHISATMPW